MIDKKMCKVICNYCARQGEEEDLVMFEDEGGFFTGCPTCETDSYLTDIEVIE